MAEIIITAKFKKRAANFLKGNNELIPKFKKTLKLLEENPHHPSLRLHKLNGKLDDYYSVSLNMKYRILLDFIIRNDQVILVDIGGHELYS